MELRPTAATVKTPAENFTGDVYLNPIFTGDGTSRLYAALVRFTPGARDKPSSSAASATSRFTSGAYSNGVSTASKTSGAMTSR